MSLNPPITLKVVFTNVQPTADPNIYTTTFTASSQSYNGGTSQYNATDIAVGMWAINNDYGYSFQVKSVQNESAESVDVVLEDVNGYNAAIDPSGIGGGPGNNTVGYVFQLGSDGLPAIVDLMTNKDFNWTYSQLSRFLYGTGTPGPDGAQGVQGPQGPAGSIIGSQGVALPPGGTQGQVLTKIDGVDYNATWSNASGSGNNIYNDEWISKNLVNPPPTIVFETVQATSTEIYVPWIYPYQIPAGFSWIPAITTLCMQISVDSNASYPGVNPYFAIPLSNVSTGFLNYHDGNPFVTGIILSKLSGTSQIESRTFPDSSQRKAYVYHDVQVGSMISSINSFITGWYGNANPSTNRASTSLMLFSRGGPPSLVQTLNLTLSTVTGSISYAAPVYVDSTDPSSKLSITLYTLTYSSAASIRRYGTPVSDSSRTVLNGTNLSYSLASLFPDSLYTVSVTATNSGGVLGPSASVTGTTQYFLPISGLSGTLPFPPRYYNNGTIVNLLTGVPKAKLINSTIPWILSSSLKIPIHNASTRGSSQTSALMSLSMTLVNGTSTINGPSLPFSGFPSAGSPAATSLNSLTLTPSIIDSYTSQAVNQQGFYLESGTSLSINTPAFVPSQSDYTLTLAQSGTFTGSASFVYQYDTLITSNPTISSISFSLNTPNVKAVTGVYVFYQSQSFSLTTTVRNMGNYYYSSPLLTYAGYTPSSEITPSNVTSGLSNGRFSSIVVFQNTNVQSASLTNVYSNKFTISVNANNVFGQSASFTPPQIPAIIDGPSVTLVYTTLPQTLPTLSVSAGNLIGYLVNSGLAGPVGVPSFLNGSSPYASGPFDQTADISTTEHLQISNGTFTTPGGQVYGYADYRSMSSSSVNYSGISQTSYRYMTLAWVIAVAPTIVYGTLTFTLVGQSGISIVNNLAVVGSTPIQLFYRIEDQASPSPTNLANLSSAWINGNSTSGISSTSGNYYLPTDSTQPPNYGLNRITGSTSLSFSVKIPSLVVRPGKTVNLYCRVGLPMGSPCSFNYIAATLGT